MRGIVTSICFNEDLGTDMHTKAMNFQMES